MIPGPTLRAVWLCALIAAAVGLLPQTADARHAGIDTTHLASAGEALEGATFGRTPDGVGPFGRFVDADGRSTGTKALTAAEPCDRAHRRCPQPTCSHATQPVIAMLRHRADERGRPVRKLVGWPAFQIVHVASIAPGEIAPCATAPPIRSARAPFWRQAELSARQRN